MNYGGHFEFDTKKQKIEQLEKIMNEPDFWSDKKKSEDIINEHNKLKQSLENITSLKNKIEGNIEILKLLKKENDNELFNLITSDEKEIKDKLDKLEVELLLSDKYDKLDCILEVHSGAGGTEACDWASMLDRMYNRWCEKHNYKVEIIDVQYGEEAGIKSKTMIVKGENAYGYLKCEKGVHRLVRLSPFDSNNRRHTSFASINTTPYFKDNDISIDIKDADIRIDIYRSSGCGGQGVNTTDSAVRITHLPTNIVVTCQNERSQIRNKEIALSVLKNKLYNLEMQKKEEELNKIKGQNSDINFGSQIRNYVMHPYSLVKDTRTNTETSDVLKVLDGDIDIFILDNLKGVKHV